MIDRKQALLVGVFGGIIFYMVPGIITALEPTKIIFQIVGGLLMFAGVVYFVAYDAFSKLGTGGGSSMYDKDIKKSLQQGRITEQQAFALQKKRLEENIELEKQKLKLEKQRKEISNLKQKDKKSFNMGAITGSGEKKESKLPDVLGNLGPMMAGGEQKKKKNEQNLKDLF